MPFLAVQICKFCNTSLLHSRSPKERKNTHALQAYLVNAKARSCSTVREVYCLHYIFSGRELWCQKTGAIIILGIDADFTGEESALTKFRNQSFLIAELGSFSFPKRKWKYHTKKKKIFYCFVFKVYQTPDFLSLPFYLSFKRVCTNALTKMEEIVGKNYLFRSSLSPPIWT